MKKTLFFVSLAAIALLFNSCYNDLPNGRDISIYTMKDRMVGKWEWRIYEEEQLNVTAKYLKYTIEFGTSNDMSICSPDGKTCDAGTWDFIKNKQQLQIILTDSSTITNTFPGKQAIAVTIMRLKKDECWIKYAGNKADALKGVKAVPAIYWELRRPAL